MKSQTYYRIDVNDRGSYDPSGGGVCGGGVLPHGMVMIEKFVGGSETDWAYACSSNTVTGTNSVRVVADGRTITVIANGSKVLSYSAPDPIHSGGVGVHEAWEQNGWYDNAVVRALS